MVYRWLFGFKIWQMLAVIIAGGWALFKFFELVDKGSSLLEDNQ